MYAGERGAGEAVELLANNRLSWSDNNSLTPQISEDFEGATTTNFLRVLGGLEERPAHYGAGLSGKISPPSGRFYLELRDVFIFGEQHLSTPGPPHSTVTDFARFLGLSISVPRASAA